MRDFASVTPWQSNPKSWQQEQNAGEPWPSLWPCQDQGVDPMDFAGATSPGAVCPAKKGFPFLTSLSLSVPGHA